MKVTKRKLAVTAVAVLAVLGLAFAAGGRASAASTPKPITPPAAGMHLVPRTGITPAVEAPSGFCWDDPNDSKSNGTRYQIWACNGNEQQNFRANSLSNGTLQLENHNGTCLDDDGDSGANGTPLIVWACNSADHAQQWYLGNYGDGTYDYYNAYSGVWIDLTGDRLANGTKLQLWAGLSDPSQKFWPFNGANGGWDEWEPEQ